MAVNPLNVFGILPVAGLMLWQDINLLSPLAVGGSFHFNFTTN
jgi:hypothetical protein